MRGAGEQERKGVREEGRRKGGEDRSRGAEEQERKGGGEVGRWGGYRAETERYDII